MAHLYKKHSALVFFIFLLVLAVIVAWPYITAIVGAMIIAILVNPVYKVVHQVIRRDTPAALLTAIIMVLLILTPLALMANMLIVEIGATYSNINTILSNRSIDIPALIDVADTITGTSFDVRAFVSDISSAFIRRAQNFVIGLPGQLIVLFVVIFLVYYFLKEQKNILRGIRELLPLGDDEKELLLLRIKQVTRGVLYGTLLTAAIQGLLAGVGYYLFGVSAPIFLGLLTAFFSLIPFIGAAAVWLPVSVYTVLVHLDDGMWWRGVGVFIYGALVVSSIDNLVKPKLIGDQARLHPALALLGVLGGLQVFGLVGVILGPLILGIFFEFLSLFKQQI